MSERVWDFRWADVLPWTFQSGILCERRSVDDILPFIREHYSRLFEGTAERFFSEPPTEAKLRFYRESDAFVFLDGGEMVGYMLANPVDWSTYYLRTAGILPEYQDRNIGSDWLRHTAELLRGLGAHRLESETAPANHRVVHIFNRLGFVITSTSQTDRWGVLLRFTKYLDDAPANVFAEQYCIGGGLLKRQRPHTEPRQ